MTREAWSAKDTVLITSFWCIYNLQLLLTSHIQLGGFKDCSLDKSNINATMKLTELLYCMY